jgi:hypothetical protein
MCVLAIDIVFPSRNPLTFAVPVTAGQKSSLGKEGSDRLQL